MIRLQVIRMFNRHYNGLINRCLITPRPEVEAEVV